MLDPKVKNIVLNDKEYILYAKHFIINNIGLKGQKRFKQAKILIIGAGGIGCPAMLYLAACGIGSIGIIDDDTVNLSNLNRQVLYYYDDINKNKIRCAKEKLNYINPHCKIILHQYKINHKNASEIMQYYDIIVDATDNFETRYIIDEYCYRLHKIHIYAAVSKFESQFSILNYKNNIRYHNIYPQEMSPISNKCDSEGILGVVTGHVGILQATEIIKIVLGLKKNIHNYLLIYNLLDISLQSKKLYFTSNYNYQYTKNKKSYKSISQKQLEKYLHNKILRKNIIILDVRDKYEFSNYIFKYTIHVPISKFKINKTINFFKNLVKKTIFIYCNTKYRSIIISNICNNNKICNYIIEN